MSAGTRAGSWSSPGTVHVAPIVYALALLSGEFSPPTLKTAQALRTT
jgi:hypothetical protein